MKTQFEVRYATEDDVPQIARIYNDAIENTTATFDTEPKTIENRLKWYRNRTKDYPVIVATIDGSVVGWAELKPFGARGAYRYTVENAIYVAPDAHRRGIGSALLRKLVDIAIEKRFHVILALVVNGNEGSIRLHKKLGFEQVGLLREVGRKFGTWLDIVTLEKTLYCPDNK